MNVPACNANRGCLNLPSVSPERRGWPWTEGGGRRTEDEGQRLEVGWPRITVVTPSFNQGRFIEETIRSVLMQGYPNLEYIIIDGGSTDETVEIIKKYEPWLAYWVSESDAGQTDAIERGLSRATGDILAYLNSDDCYAPGALTVAAKALGNSAPELIYGSYAYIDEASNETQVFRSPDFDLRQLMLGNYISQQTVFFTRNVYRTVGHFDTSLHYVMDYDYWLRSILAGFSFGRRQEKLASFRMHGASKTVAQPEAFWGELLRVLERAYAHPNVPSAMRAVQDRAFCRANWTAAADFNACHDLCNASAHIVAGLRWYRSTPSPSDFAILANMTMLSDSGHLIGPDAFARRLKTLGMWTRPLRDLGDELDEEYLKKYLGTYQTSTALDRLLCLSRLLLNRPSRIRKWSVRKFMCMSLRIAA